MMYINWTIRSLNSERNAECNGIGVGKVDKEEGRGVFFFSALRQSRLGMVRTNQVSHGTRFFFYT